MAFTNPILAGPELARTDIRSDNYTQGQSGWLLARNGSAEFDSLLVRNSLNVSSSIKLQGKDLATLLNTRALGCVGWINGYPTTATTTEDQIFFTEVDVIQGRLYEVVMSNVTPDISTTKGTEFRIRYLTGTAAFPTNTSPILAITLRLSQFEMGQIRSYYYATASTRLRLRASIASLDGTSVRTWTPGSGGVLAVNDLGISPIQNGIVGNTPPGQTLKEWTITASDYRTYLGNGGLVTKGGYMFQGDFGDGNGNYRSWCVYNSTDLALLNDLIGVAPQWIQVCELYLSYDIWYLNRGYGSIGYHNKTSLPNTSEQSGGVAGKLITSYSGPGEGWTGLESSTGTGSIMEALNNGYLRGFMLGNYGGTDKYYAGKAVGIGPDAPRLHARYLK